MNLLLKIFLNEDSGEFYSTNGVKQGEAISFSSTLKISEKREIHQIRFTLIDSFDLRTTYAQGVF